MSIPLLFPSFNNVFWAPIMGQVLCRPNHVQKRLHLWLTEFTAQEGSNPKVQHWWNDKHEEMRKNERLFVRLKTDSYMFSEVQLI